MLHCYDTSYIDTGVLITIISIVLELCYRNLFPIVALKDYVWFFGAKNNGKTFYNIGSRRPTCLQKTFMKEDIRVGLILHQLSIKICKLPFRLILFFNLKNLLAMGSGCGSVGRAVASNSRGPWFEFSHQQTFILNIVFCQLYWKYENKIKRGREGPFKKIFIRS